MLTCKGSEFSLPRSFYYTHFQPDDKNFHHMHGQYFSVIAINVTIGYFANRYSNFIEENLGGFYL